MHILFTQIKVSGNNIQVPINILIVQAAWKVSAKAVYMRLRKSAITLSVPLMY